MRARLAASNDLRRRFRVVLDTASKAGLVGPRLVLDPTTLYDAVATMDTVTLIRSAKVTHLLDLSRWSSTCPGMWVLIRRELPHPGVTLTPSNPRRLAV